MKKNSIQFAVVREDPQIELDIVSKFRLKRATLIGSGGCTAFCLKTMNPDIEISLIEPNTAQIGLIKEKIRALKTYKKEDLYRKFGVGNSDSESFIECGNFESLFRQFRLFVQEFIISEAEIERAFNDNSPRIWQEVFKHSFWQVAFDLFFSDSILKTMFGEAAIQHAPKDSYPIYFRNVLEKGLLRSDAHRNYFLHHIFLGFYFPDENSLPDYLVNLPKNLEFEFFDGFAQDFAQFKGRQLVHFSNIFDWCDENIVKEIINSAIENLEKGSIVVFRQLNNRKNYREFFGQNFKWSDTNEVVEKDRSLFYEKLEIGEKIK
jgi:S-adenosylmethionine-diacylglycerol 3-amino-3-carboxypropyl transferase